MASVLRILALLYLVAVSFFIYGWLTVELKIFPYRLLEPHYSELYEFFAQSDKESLADMVAYDHQERKNEFEFSGLRIGDNSFSDPGFLLLSRYVKEDGIAVVELFSLKQSRVLHKWVPDLDTIFERSPDFSTGYNTRQAYRSQHPFLLENGDLLVTSGEGPLVRINPCGDVVWLINRHFHHSIEATERGTFLVPIVIREGKDISGNEMRFDGFAEISADGAILNEFPIHEAMMASGYQGLVYGVGEFEADRYHLNDVQPVPGKPDKVLLSIRNVSSVAQMDIAAGKIDWLQTGPWINQHDVNPLADGWVSVFGNDFIRGSRNFMSPGHSQVYTYNPQSGEIATPYAEVLARLQLRTKFQGRAEILGNGDVFIEETNRDRLVRLSDSEVRWQYVAGVTDTSTGALHWSRYLRAQDVPEKLLEKLHCSRS